MGRRSWHTEPEPYWDRVVYHYDNSRFYEVVVKINSNGFNTFNVKAGTCDKYLAVTEHAGQS